MTLLAAAMLLGKKPTLIEVNGKRARHTHLDEPPRPYTLSAMVDFGKGGRRRVSRIITETRVQDHHGDAVNDINPWTLDMSRPTSRDLDEISRRVPPAPTTDIRDAGFNPVPLLIYGENAEQLAARKRNRAAFVAAFQAAHPETP